MEDKEPVEFTLQASFSEAIRDKIVNLANEKHERKVSRCIRQIVTDYFLTHLEIKKDEKN